jgi:hypothetical protein
MDKFHLICFDNFEPGRNPGTAAQPVPGLARRRHADLRLRLFHHTENLVFALRSTMAIGDKGKLVSAWNGVWKSGRAERLRGTPLQNRGGFGGAWVRLSRGTLSDRFSRRAGMMAVKAQLTRRPAQSRECA